jgi:hypothetical protein
MTHLDGSVLHGVGGSETGHDFAGCKNLNLEFVVARFGDRLSENF